MKNLKVIEDQKMQKVSDIIYKREPSNSHNSTSSTDKPSAITVLDQARESLYYSLSQVKTPQKLQEYIPSEYASLAKVLSTKNPVPNRGPVLPVPPVRKESITAQIPPVPDRNQIHSAHNLGNHIKPLPNRPLDTAKSQETRKLISYKPKYDDFTILKVLGQGSFGKVLLAQWKNSSKVVA